MRLNLPFRQAISGGERMVHYQHNGHTEQLQVRIPPGIESGKKLRVSGKGGPAPQGGKAGDLLLEIHVEKDPLFCRDGQDLTLQIQIPFSGACLGTTTAIETLSGEKRIKIPAGTASGSKIRLKGHGVPAHGKMAAGDLYAQIQVMVPKKLDERQRELLEQLHQCGL